MYPDELLSDPIFKWAQLVSTFPQLIDLEVYNRLSDEHLETLITWQNKQASEDEKIQREL